MQPMIAMYGFSLLTLFSWLTLYTELKKAKKKYKKEVLRAYLSASLILTIIALLSWLL